jgi:hypothetical protein
MRTISFFSKKVTLRVDLGYLAFKPYNVKFDIHVKKQKKLSYNRKLKAKTN